MAGIRAEALNAWSGCGLGVDNFFVGTRALQPTLLLMRLPLLLLLVLLVLLLLMRLLLMGLPVLLRLLLPAQRPSSAISNHNPIMKNQHTVAIARFVQTHIPANQPLYVFSVLDEGRYCRGCL